MSFSFNNLHLLWILLFCLFLYEVVGFVQFDHLNFYLSFHNIIHINIDLVLFLLPFFYSSILFFYSSITCYMYAFI